MKTLTPSGSPGEDQGQNSHSQDVSGGDPDTDNALGDQIDAANEQGDGGNLAHAAADVADKHISQRGIGGDAALHEVHGQGVAPVVASAAEITEAQCSLPGSTQVVMGTG